MSEEITPTITTPTGTLSQQEALKSARDALIVSVAALIPQLLEIASQTNWGEYSTIASVVLAIAAPLINRLLNIWRI